MTDNYFRRVLVVASLLAAISAVGTSVASAALTLGALVQWTGTGASAGVDGFIYDKDIHSGVFRDVNASPSLLSGAPLLSDAYVLQGGDPFGGDTGDDFEVTQAHGLATVGGFTIQTGYDFGQPAVQVGTFITANPDTGFVEFTNNTGSVWTGTLTLSGQAFGGIYGPAQIFSNSAAGLTLANGASVFIVLNDESSNYGGYNHPDADGVVDLNVPEPASLVIWSLLGLVGVSVSWALKRKQA